jgi:hypothetical protein
VRRPGGDTPGKTRLFPDRPKVENSDFVGEYQIPPATVWFLNSTHFGFVEP